MKIGAVTIGQSPRRDIIPEIREILDSQVEILEKGALDGLTLQEVKEYSPAHRDFPLVTRMHDGTEVIIAKKHIIPRISDCIYELEQSEVEIIVLLCTGKFPGIKSKKILLQPYRIIQNMVNAIMKKGRLGVIVPSADQIPGAEKKWDRTKYHVIVDTVSPYAGSEKEIIEKAKKIKNNLVDIIILDCIGYNKKMKAFFKDITRKPVILPRTILARIINEIIVRD